MSTPISIFLTGATGFIGGHTLRALSARGHDVACLVRHPDRHAVQQLASLPGVTLVAGEWTVPRTWLHHVAGHDVVVNTVGVIRERRGATFATVHTDVPMALFEAAARAGERKIVQVSALGADDGAQSAFHRSKRAADQYLVQLGVPYVILRPSLVYGTRDHSMAFFARLAALPLTPVPGDGQYRVQPLHVNDLVHAVVQSAERAELAAVTVDVGGAEALTFDALLDLLARRHGKRHGARKIHIPWSMMRLAATATDLLGGHGPITRDEVGMLRRGNVADIRPFVDRFGFEPLPFGVGIAQR
jgi:NADH dehydrogenase